MCNTICSSLSYGFHADLVDADVESGGNFANCSRPSSKAHVVVFAVGSKLQALQPLHNQVGGVGVVCHDSAGFLTHNLKQYDMLGTELMQSCVCMLLQKHDSFL